MIKCELVIGGKVYRVTDDLVNWDDVQLSIKRADYDGVTRSFSSKFEFTNGAYSILKRQYIDYYLNASATMIISRRNNSWTWNELFKCTLDFSTYEDTGRNISINAVDDSLASIIKAKKGTQYEYMVDEIKDDAPLYYDGLELNESANWLVAGDSVPYRPSLVSVQISASIKPQLFPLYVSSTEISHGNQFSAGDTPAGFAENNSNSYLLKSISSGNIAMRVHIYINIDPRRPIQLELRRYNKSGESYDTIASSAIVSGNSGYVLKMEFNGDIQMDEGSYLIISFFSIYDLSIFVSGVTLEAKWTSKAKPVNIDVVSPSRLLNVILRSINGGRDGLTGYINSESDHRMSSSKIISAESIRAISGAKLYTSFDKFAEWMKVVFGYVYEINGDSVTFKHRSKFFGDYTIKGVYEFDDFSYSVNQSLIYSSVRAGYDRQEYDSVNGRDEFRFTNTYSTGITLTDNILDLISPYRADAYGIEFLTQKRGKDTTDTNSDNNVFFVGATMDEEINTYKLIRSSYIIDGVVSKNTMFNAMYSPRSILIANKGIIGASASALTFDSSEGNSDVVINGISEREGVLIPENERLFTVGLLSFKTSDGDVPERQDGMIFLEKNGETYLGYNLKTDINIGKEESVKYSLAVRRIE